MVVPPQLIRPASPRTPPPGVRPEELPEVEILVASTGDVETVRLLSPESGRTAAILLSAVKAWVFEPATRAGQPVKYRLRMRVPSR
jgi:hypothetical protein